VPTPPSRTNFPAHDIHRCINDPRETGNCQCRGRLFLLASAKADQVLQALLQMMNMIVRHSDLGNPCASALKLHDVRVSDLLGIYKNLSASWRLMNDDELCHLRMPPARVILRAFLPEQEGKAAVNAPIPRSSQQQSRADVRAAADDRDERQRRHRAAEFHLIDGRHFHQWNERTAGSYHRTVSRGGRLPRCADSRSF